MSKEAPKFRPNEPEEQRKWQEEIANKFGVEHNAEYFKVPVKKPDGSIETHFIPKHSGEGLDTLTIKELGRVPRKEVIEAIKEIYPELYRRGEEPNLVKAIGILRERKKP